MSERKSKATLAHWEGWVAPVIDPIRRSLPTVFRRDDGTIGYGQWEPNSR